MPTTTHDYHVIMCPCGFETKAGTDCTLCGADAAYVAEHGEPVISV